MSSTSAPSPEQDARVDKHVGERLRARRKGAGLSQAELAGVLGVSFQQLQKYEKGTNRISAPRLLAAARALGCAVGNFFEGIELVEQADLEPHLATALDRARAIQQAAHLVPEIARIPSLTPSARGAIRTIILECGRAPEPSAEAAAA